MRKRWTPEEEATLCKLFAAAPREVIHAAIPGRTWTAIEVKAAQMLIGRWTRKCGIADISLVRELRAERRRNKLTQRTVARRLKMGRVQLGEYEIGRRTPTIRTLMRWAEAINLEVSLVPKGQARLARMAA